LDIVGNRLPNLFVRRQPSDKYIVPALLEDLGPTDGVLIYPEGTRFTPVKRERILDHIQKTGDTGLYEKARALKNVLPPRLGGALNLWERNERADFFFGAHRGLDETVDLRDFLRGSLVGSVVRVRFWRTPFEGIPAGRARQIDWLFEQWSRVD